MQGEVLKAEVLKAEAPKVEALKGEVLKAEALSVVLEQKKWHQEIIRDVSFTLHKGECLGILGESGSGKSMTVKAILGLLDKNFAISGQALYKGKDLLQQKTEDLRRCRGREITMILQNPMTCFDPLCRIGDQMKETYQAHGLTDTAQIRSRSVEVLERMQIKNPAEVLRKYPHQLSGGMLQRVMIGLALSMEPEILIADEPTTAIDAITQYEIMKEFRRIKDAGETSMIFITHDLGVMSVIADRILVMNQGRIADQGDFNHIMNHARDPYTRMLVSSRQKVMGRYEQMLGGM